MDGFVKSREKLVELIKAKEPTMSELVIILKKKGFKTQNEMEAFIVGWNIMQYIKKDKQFLIFAEKYKKLKSEKNKKKLLTETFNKVMKKKSIMTKKVKKY